MAHCKRCNREIPRGIKKSEHVCDTVVLSDGTETHVSNLDKETSRTHQRLDAGEVQISHRRIRNPIQEIGDRFGRKEKKDKLEVRPNPDSKLVLPTKEEIQKHGRTST